MKLCKDCKHVRTRELENWFRGYYTEYTCTHSKVSSIEFDAVDGSMHCVESCSLVRREGFPCGPHGRFWESKRSLSDKDPSLLDFISLTVFIGIMIGFVVFVLHGIFH